MISIKQLQFRYPSSQRLSLHNIDLHIERGSLFGLLGPNGAGKTTLLSILSGLLPCPPEHVFIDGRDLASSDTLKQVRLALVPQEYAFYLPLSVRENLNFFAGVQGISKAAIGESIDRVVAMTGLADRLDERASNLSGGLKRRLNLAIGLLNQPRLLLLDEPTVGIDPHSRHFILQTIKSLSEQGATVIYTSHYMEEVQSLCDKIAIIDHGQVLLDGDLQSLLESAGSDLLRLEFNQPLDDVCLLAMPQVEIVNREAQRLEVRINNIDELLMLLNLLRDCGICKIEYGNHTLESLFLNLTQRTLRD